MLQKELSKRATLEDMMTHPWTTSGGTVRLRGMSEMEKASVTASAGDIKRAVTELSKISNLVQAKLAAGLFKKKTKGRLKVLSEEKEKEKAPARATVVGHVGQGRYRRVQCSRMRMSRGFFDAINRKVTQSKCKTQRVKMRARCQVLRP